MLRRQSPISRRPQLRPPVAPVVVAAAAAAPATTPLTIISSVPVSQWVRADLGITIDTGVSVWADQSGNGRDFTQGTAGAQPTRSASDATLNNQATVTFDGVAQFISSAWVRTAPGTTPTWISAIIKQISSASARNLIADTAASRFIIRQTATSPNLLAFMTAGGNTNTTLAIGSWGRAESGFTASTSDYLKLKSTNVTGASGGAGGAGNGTRLGSDATAALFANFAIAELIITAGLPSGAEITAIDAYYTARYGAGLV